MTDNYTVSRRHDWQLPVFAFVLVISILVYVWFAIITDIPKTADKTADKVSITPSHIDTTSQEDPAPVGMIMAANIGQTLTPFQPVTNTPAPTVTREPTKTQYPTFTHTAQLVSDNKDTDTIIRYEQIVVTVVVEILITPHATPTPQPTPDYRATQSALTTAAAKRAGQWETIAIWTVAFTISVLAGIVLVVIVRAMWEWLTSPKVQVNETREEIIAPAMSPVPGVTAQQYKDILIYDAMYTNGVKTHTDTAIAQLVFDYTGGDAIPKVRLVRAHNAPAVNHSPTPRE